MDMLNLATVLPQAQFDSAMSESDVISPSFGTQLILHRAHFDKILAHLSHLITVDGSTNKKASSDQIGRIPTIYFDLLSRYVKTRLFVGFDFDEIAFCIKKTSSSSHFSLSEHIQSPEFGVLFARTLLRYLTSKRALIVRRKSPDKLIIVLDTLARLAPHLEDPLDAIWSILCIY